MRRRCEDAHTCPGLQSRHGRGRGGGCEGEGRDECLPNKGKTDCNNVCVCYSTSLLVVRRIMIDVEVVVVVVVIVVVVVMVYSNSCSRR